MDVVSKAWKVQLPTFAIFLVAYYAGLPDILMGYINEEPLESLVIFLIVNTAGWMLAAKFHAIIQKTFLAWMDVTLFNPITKSTKRIKLLFSRRSRFPCH